MIPLTDSKSHDLTPEEILQIQEWFKDIDKQLKLAVKYRGQKLLLELHRSYFKQAFRTKSGELISYDSISDMPKFNPDKPKAI